MKLWRLAGSITKETIMPLRIEGPKKELERAQRQLQELHCPNINCALKKAVRMQQALRVIHTWMSVIPDDPRNPKHCLELISSSLEIDK
jgi:hypothetical protein